jgi:hypothetical protein
MGRHQGIFARLTAVGALLAIVWITSYRRAIELQLPAAEHGRAVNVCIYRGLAMAMVIDDSPIGRFPGLIFADGHEAVRAACWDEAYWQTSYLGLSAADSVTWLTNGSGRAVSREYQSICLPFWGMLTMWAAMAVLRLRRAWRMSKREAMGLCPQCGYDLRSLKIECPACVARTSILHPSPRLQLIH